MRKFCFLMLKPQTLWVLPLVLFTLLFHSSTLKAEKLIEDTERSRLITLTFVLSDFNGFAVSCAGAADGSIDLIPDGGVAPYTYVWSNGAAVEDVSGLIAGTYTVTVTDFLGDTQTGSVTLTSPLSLTIAPNTVLPDSCGGTGDGRIFITVNGGVLPYDYLWSDGSVVEDPAGLTSGSYTITVTDDNACSAQVNGITVPQVDAMSLSLLVTDVACFGEATGSISAGVQSGNQPFVYVWSNGSASALTTGLSTGTFTVTVTDADACTVSGSAAVAQPLGALSLGAVAVDPKCFGAANGSIDLTVGGGTSPYTYAWSNGSANEDLFGLLAGVYTVTVTDANACISVLDVTVGQPLPLQAATSVSNVSCNGAANGSIDLTVSGGIAGFTYVWSNSVTNEDLSGLAPGTYTVTVTDANLCTISTSASIVQPAPLGLSSTVTNVVCNGAATGGVDLTVTGGTSAYSYAWSNGSTTQDVSGLTAGSYTVTVTDANGCTAQISVNVTEASLIGLVFVPVAGTCNAANGSVTVLPAGGTPPYTYLWNNGANTQVVSGLAAGAYTVTVSDAALCAVSSAVTILNSGSPNTILSNQVDVACNGGNDGLLDITVSGGTPPYTYAWSNGAITQDIAALTAGSYTLTVSDVNNCIRTFTYAISQPPAINSSGVVSNVLCNGGSTGSINFSASGGTGTLNYLWSNGASVQDPTGLISGTYTVTITDANACTASNIFTVAQPSVLSATASSTQSGCGVATGTATVTASGATSPYSYLWSNGAVTASISNIAAGVYTVTVSDANACTAVRSVTVVSANAPQITSSIIDSVNCNSGSDGSVDISVSSGTPPYSYTWSNGVSVQDLTGLAAGTYLVTVNDANNCSVSASYTIGQPTALLISGVVGNVNCFGNSNGSIDLSVSGGTGAYSYLWNGGAITQDRSGLVSGSYTVTVSDGNACTSQSAFTVVQPSAITSSGAVIDVLCNGGSTGSIDLSASGGTGTLNYLWSNGASVQDPTGLISGNYTVTITDANACTASNVFTIAQPSVLSATISSTQSGCGVATGTASATASGGTAPFAYQWSNGASSAVITNVASGNYTVTITDVNACSLIRNVSVTSANAPTISSAVVDSVSCNGGADGAIDITMSSGTPPYTFLWSNGAVVEDVAALVAGSYTVTVTDANNCSISASYLVVEPAALTINGNVSNVSCFGNSTGAIDIIVSGGVGGYTYAWSNGASVQDLSLIPAGTYSVTVTDQNACSTQSAFLVIQPANLTASINPTDVLCNGDASGSIALSVFGGSPPFAFQWSNGANTQNISGLTAGGYTITITDDLGCTRIRTTLVNEPQAIQISVAATDESCNQSNGTATATAIGGTGILSYLWNTGVSTAQLTGLVAGTYTVTVTDANACVEPATVVVGVAGSPLISGAVVDSVSCNGGTDGGINISVSGGVTPYTYLWSNAATAQDLTGLQAGVYTVTVTDVNGCSTIEDYAVFAPPALTASFTTVNATCGNANGSLQAVVSGGTPGYTLSWSNGQSTTNINSLLAGVYTVTVSDANGCSVQYANTVSDDAGPQITNALVQDVLCNSGSTGGVVLTVSGGFPPLTYQWSNGQTGNNLVNVAIGTFTVTVTDANGCNITASYVIAQPSFLAAPITTSPSFCGQTNGQATANSSGGVPPYSYVWSNGQVTQTITGIGAGTYTVTVTDANGCTRRRSASVTLANGPVITLVGQQDVTCSGGVDGAIDISVSGGVAPYQFTWSNGSISEDVSGLPSGIYTVIVTDSAQCSDSLQVEIFSATPLSISSSVTDASCGLSDGSISLQVSGGAPGYTFQWSNGQTGPAIAGLIPGNYTVTITDANACDTLMSFAVNSLPGPIAVVDSIRGLRCFGINNGRIFISVSGGTSPYTYLWSDGNTAPDRFGLAAGIYSVSVTDAGGCTTQLSATVLSNTALAAAFSSQQASCNQSNGSATVVASGGVAPYTFQWETGSTAGTINGLAAGIYAVTITDSLGCVKADSVNITNTGSPVIQLQNQTQPTCYGSADGSLTISITSGTSPYALSWSNGDVGFTAAPLAAGSYAITITDALGCIALQTFVLSQPDSIEIGFTNSPANCGFSNGDLTALASGGTGAFSYLWSNGILSSTNNNVVSGVYTVTVTDQNGCVNSDTVRVDSVPGPQLSLVQVTPVACFGAASGAIDVSVASGTGPFNYSWSSGQISQDLTSVIAGVYSVTVTDAAGCTDTLIAAVGSATPISISAVVDDAGCGNANGSATLTASGGTPGYVYLWSTGTTGPLLQNVVAGTYSVTVTDANNCTQQQIVTINNQNAPSIALVSMVPTSCQGGADGQLDINVLQGVPPFNYQWSNGSQSQDLLNVPAGVYSLTLTDGNGCVSFFVDTVTQPLPLSISFTSVNASCNLSNGIITAQASGGTPVYTYLWSTGVGSSVLSGINAGAFTVTVTDQEGCTGDSSFTIVNSGVPVITLANLDSVSCNGGNDGTIDINVTGGLSPYLYTWINSAQTTDVITGLSAGGYSAIVTDDAGCTATQSYTVFQPAPLQLVFSSVIDAACGQSNGAVSASVSGGVPGYSYLWSNSFVSDSIFNLVAGVYTLTVTDFNGCTASAIANISNLSGPSLTDVDSNNVSCNGGSDGNISITASSVSQPLSYAWTGLTDTLPSLSNLSAGAYTITVTDAAGCVLVRTISITEPAAFVVNAVITQKNPPYNLSCYAADDGELFLSVVGGTAPYSFVWSNGAITQNLLNLPANTFTVVITDANACTTSSSFSVTEPPQLTANAGVDFIVCGQSAATLSASVPVGGIGFWQVVSSDSTIIFTDSTSASAVISNLSTGDNVLLWTVSDGICSAADQVIVTSATEIQAIGGIDRRVCGDNVNLNATRPEFGYGYWTSLSAGPQIADSTKAFTAVTGIAYGLNSFLWTVVNGTCRDSVVVNITRRDTLDCLPRVELPTAFSPNFDGSNDYLVIKGLDEYPDNEVLIYNRWGQLVYSTAGYRNDWYGLDRNGYPLADGTYFVIVKVNYINKVYNTYIDLRR